MVWFTFRVFMLVFFTALALQGYAAGRSEIVINKPRNSSTYMLGLMEKALSYSVTNYEVKSNAETLSRSAQTVAVKSGELSVMWGGTSEQMEEDFIPVRIDGYRGMMSFRFMIIRQGDQRRFDDVYNVEDLRAIRYGQGRNWQDGVILEHSGLTVVRATKKESLFYMLDGARFDAFPRGATEAWKEQIAHPELALAVEQRLVLSYPLPTYYFVNKSRPDLAKDIEAGLEKMLLNGAFDDYFYGNDRVQQFLANANLAQRRVIKLENPFLPKSTPLDRAELWLTLDELQAGAEAFAYRSMAVPK